MSKAFEKYALKTTGLVPMRIVRGFAPHAENDIAGFPPSTAAELFTAGDAVVVDGDGKEVEILPTKPAEAEGAGGTASDATPPAIPGGWKNLHHLQLFKLVKELGGDGEATAKKEAAIAFIEAEEARRAAAQQQG